MLQGTGHGLQLNGPPTWASPLWWCRSLTVSDHPRVLLSRDDKTLKSMRLKTITFQKTKTSFKLYEKPLHMSLLGTTCQTGFNSTSKMSHGHALCQSRSS